MKNLFILFLIVSISTFANSCPFAEENQQQEITSYVQKSNLLNSGVGKKQNKKILVFISFSMPEISLRQWLSAAHKLGASVVIRGLKNNSFKDTAKTMAKLLGENKGGVELNPQAFKDFKITKVPAVVVIDKNMHYTVYGNISLEYALQVIKKHQPPL